MTDKTKFTHESRIWEDLGNAVIIQAANDYKTLYKTKILYGYESVRSDIKTLEHFFHSKLYKQITSIDGEDLMNKLRNQVMEEI